MAKERISMRNVKAVVRLHAQGMSQVQIARVLQIGRGTVQDYLRRLQGSRLDRAAIPAMSDAELEAALFPPAVKQKRAEDALEYQTIVEELRKPHATIEVLWEEYKQAHPDGYCYSHFCDRVRQYRKRMNYSMRQEHKAGDKTFVDFGEGPMITDRVTGIQTRTRLFVSVWGASTYVYAQVVPNETLPQWITANRAALEYYGCCPHAIVPDNLKAAVTTACRYEPAIHPTYLEFAQHYDTVIYPARPHKPKDKAKVENAVRLAQRWIIFRLRNRVFSTITEAQTAVIELVDRFNHRTMKRWGKSRAELFQTLDLPHAKPLPSQPYEYADWRKATVQFNYHVSYEGHEYSVPYTLIHHHVEIRATVSLIEMYHKGERICSHLRSYQKHGATTVHDHMPLAHQKYAEWTPERIMTWAEKYGPAVKEFITHVLQSRRYPEQAYKACIGIIRLGNKFSGERLNHACARALTYRAYSYRSVVTILEKGLDRTTEHCALPLVSSHENIRGAVYYQEPERAARSLSP